MHPLLFKASYDDGAAATIAYLVIGISLCAILAILHVCLYQQLHGTFEELRSAAHVKMYECIRTVVQGMQDSENEAEEPTDAATVRRIVRLFSEVQAEENERDSGTFMQLVQVCVRTLLLALCVLYDLKACLEGTRSGYRELIPSLVFISFLALADRVLNVYINLPVDSKWRVLVSMLLVLFGLAYSGGVVVTLVFYYAERSSDLLSDTRRTFLNVVLGGLMVLDAALHVGSVGLLLLPHRQSAAQVRRAASEDGQHSADEEEAEPPGGSAADEEHGQDTGKTAAAPATALGASIRVRGIGEKETVWQQVIEPSTGSSYNGILGHLSSGNTALDMQANKKNK
jgi:hypothetical protein